MDMRSSCFDRLLFARAALAEHNNDEAFRATTGLVRDPDCARSARVWLIHAQAALATSNREEVARAWRRAQACNDFGFTNGTARDFAVVLAENHLAQGDLEAALLHANQAFMHASRDDNLESLAELRAQIESRINASAVSDRGQSTDA